MKDFPVSMVNNLGPANCLPLPVVSPSDETTSENFQLNYQHSDYLDFTNRWGDWKVITLSVGIFGASLLTNDIKFQDAAFTSLQSILMTNLVTKSTKFIFGRERPGLMMIL